MLSPFSIQLLSTLLMDQVRRQTCPLPKLYLTIFILLASQVFTINWPMRLSPHDVTLRSDYGSHNLQSLFPKHWHTTPSQTMASVCILTTSLRSCGHHQRGSYHLHSSFFFIGLAPKLLYWCSTWLSQSLIIWLSILTILWSTLKAITTTLPLNLSL